MIQTSILIMGILILSTGISPTYPQSIETNESPCDAPVLCGLNGTNIIDIQLKNTPGGPYSYPGFGGGCALHDPHWFAFRAGSGTLDLDLDVVSCTGGSNSVQFTLYKGTPECSGGHGGEVDGLEIVEGDCSCIEPGVYQFNDVAIQEGALYYLVLDGCAGSLCEIKLEFEGKTINPERPDSIRGLIALGNGMQQFTDTFCSSVHPLIASINQLPEHSTHLIWSISGDTITGESDKTSIQIPNELLPTDQYTEICVRASNGCESSDPVCETIYIQEAPYTVLDETVCPDSFVTVGNDTFTEEGSYLIPLNSTSFCDSLVRLEVTAAEPPEFLGAEITVDNGMGSGTIHPSFTQADSLEFLWSNGATTPELGGLRSGTYHLTVTTRDVCTSSFSFHVPSLKKEGEKEEKIKITPLQNGIEISIRSEKNRRVHLQIFDVNGRLLLDRRNIHLKGPIRIPMQSKLPDGIYFYRIVDEEGTITSGKGLYSKIF